MLEISCSDELGHSMRDMPYCNDFLTANGHYIFPFVLKNFPRRGQVVRISSTDFSGRSNGSPVYVPNPLPGTYPIWQPEKEPASSRSGDLIGTLREFRHTDFAAPGLKEDLIRLAVQDPSGSASDWSAEKLEVSDATGNAWTVTPEHNWLQTAGRSGELHITFPSLALSDEKAFKLRLTLGRVGNLPTAETGVLRDLPVPKEGELHTEKRGATIQGSTVEVTHEIGAGASHDLGWSGDSTDFALWVRNPAADRVLRIRQPGARNWESPSFQSYTTGCYCVSVPDSAVGKRISLEVGLTRTRTLEFLVRPTAPGSK